MIDSVDAGRHNHPLKAESSGGQFIPVPLELVHRVCLQPFMRSSLGERRCFSWRASGCARTLGRPTDHPSHARREEQLDEYGLDSIAGWGAAIRP